MISISADDRDDRHIHNDCNDIPSDDSRKTYVRIRNGVHKEDIEHLLRTLYY
jgi:hypothetical protein